MPALRAEGVSHFQSNPLSRRKENLKSISGKYLKEFGSLGKLEKVNVGYFIGVAGFLETHLDGISQLLTIPSSLHN